MIYDYPSYYGKFHCIGGNCKDSCCIGWEVDIDEDTYEYYRNLKGPFGDRLRCHMRTDGEERYFPLLKNGRCPFLNKNNLCDIIIELGEESLSQVCTEYPRYFLEEGNFVQIDMSLSCMELGKIFFEDPEPVGYIREEMPDPDPVGYGGGAEGLLRKVLDIRDDCIGIMEDRSMPLAERFTEVFLLYGPKGWKEKLSFDAPAWEGGKRSLGEKCRSLPEVLARIMDIPSLLTLMDKMEVIDSRWTEEMEEIRDMGRLPEDFTCQTADRRFSVWFEKLGCYFLFRYITDAYFAEKELPGPEKAGHPGIRASVRFCARAIFFLYLMCVSRCRKNGGRFDVDDMIDLAHIYSKEVEHSDGNVELLKGI